MWKLLVLISLSFVEVQSTPTATSYDDVNQIGAFNMTLSDDTLFQQFKNNYERLYLNSSEEEKRRQIFADNVRYINKHNAKYANGESTYYLGINQFTDMTHEEFMIDYISCKNEQFSIGNATIDQPQAYVQAPSSIDWRDEGYVTRVKSQSIGETKCGSCYAFSATGAIEGQNFRKTSKLVSLSEQQLVDCSTDFGNDGCEGGKPDQAFEYVQNECGIEREVDYPYIAKATECKTSTSRIKVNIQGYEVVRSEQSLESITASYGPTSISIHVNDKFVKHKGGVFDDPECPKNANHAVLVVGYTPDYWIVKNSWGADWGENGYIRVAKNKNMCGIGDYAAVPVIESSLPTKPCVSKGLKNQFHYVFLWLMMFLCN